MTAELTSPAFEALLRLFGPDRDSAGARYEEARRRLVRLYEWRGLGRSEELADETLTRAAARLADGVVVRSEEPFAYLAGIARLVALEEFRRREKERAGLDEVARRPASPDNPDDPGLQCLERCLDRLPARSRGLVVGYYDGEGRRRTAWRARMAADLGVGEGALRVRAHRIRESLATCLNDCLAS